MKAILCAGFEKEFPKRIDEHISNLEKLKLEVVVVLGGPSSEEVLRRSQALEHCELVFDTHGMEVSVITNIHAGLHTTTEAVLVIPANAELTDEQQFLELVKTYYQEGLRTEVHGFWPADFPLLLTRAGNQFFRKAADLKDFSDPNINFVVVGDSHLATGINTL